MIQQRNDDKKTHSNVKQPLLSPSRAGQTEKQKFSNSTAFPLAPFGAQRGGEARREKLTRPLCEKLTAHMGIHIYIYVYIFYIFYRMMRMMRMRGPPRCWLWSACRPLARRPAPPFTPPLSRRQSVHTESPDEEEDDDDM